MRDMIDVQKFITGKYVFNTGENESFEFSTEALQELDITVDDADNDDEDKTVDFKPPAGLQRPPPTAVFW